MSAGAAGRLRALPADATATEVLCAALGCDRRALSSWPGGAALELASMLSGAADVAALEALCRDLDEVETGYIVAAGRAADGRARELALALAQDFDEAAHRVRAAIGREET